jgi:hypothetical protein
MTYQLIAPCLGEWQLDTKEKRRSDRVSFSVPIHTSWLAPKGQHFAENARTLTVSRYGATIVLPRELAPVQEITIRCVETEKEATARVVGKIRVEPEGHVYGVAFLDPNVNLWNVEFPPLGEDDKAESPVFLECASCLTRAVIHLDEIQTEIFEARRLITLSCKRCGSWTVWGLAAHETPHDTERQCTSESSPDSAPRTLNRRKYGRILTRMTACVRHAVLTDEVVRVKDASRGGFRFVSSNYYEEGSSIMVAMPYTRDASNVFVPARVMWRQELRRVKKFEYGVSYGRSSGNPPRR